MNAQQARQLTDKAKKYANEYKSALDKINDAASIGECSITRYDLSEFTIKNLERLGYVVKVMNADIKVGPLEYVISW